MSPTWRSSRRSSPTARSSPSPARSRTRPTSAARCRARPRPTATEMYHEGLLLPPIKIWAAGEPLPDVERIILTNSRQPELMRGDIHAQIAVTQMGVERVKELCARFGARHADRRLRRHPQGRRRRTARRDRQAARRRVLGRGLPRQRRHRGRQADQARRHRHDQGRHRAFRFLRQRPAGQGAGQPAAVHGRGLRVLFADRQPRPRHRLQRRHARRGADQVCAAHHRQRRSAGAGLELPDGQPAAGRRDPGGAGAFQSEPRAGAFRRVERAQHRLEQGPAGPDQPAIRDRRLRLRRRHGPRRRDRHRDAPEQPAHHADRDAGIRVSLPHHPLRPGSGFRRHRAAGAAGSRCGANTNCWRTPP